ncbi:MAG: hypothetical protein NVSMB33_04060 [Ktedonobacteraceae bacterium]
MDLIIFTGLQGAGKSTFYLTYFADTHIYVSKDVLHNNRRPQRRQMQLIEDALREQRSVVVDNTNSSVEVRKPLIEVGRLYGAEIVGYYFESSVSECIQRNKQRTGKAKVPVVAIYATAKRLVRPAYEEGFDRLYEVRIGDEGKFEVRRWEKIE